VHVGNSSATAFNFMPLELGIKKGNFAKNRLDVQVVDLGGASKIYQAVIAGSLTRPSKRVRSASPCRIASR
jgi:ABC-type nitrate/sulfonate/bicarbonate transport system substrate-binding protein